MVSDGFVRTKSESAGAAVTNAVMSSTQAADRRRSPRQQHTSTPRKSLKTLQHVATDKENLTGRSPISHKKNQKDIKMYLTSETMVESRTKTDTKLKKMKNTSTQAEECNKITEADLTTDAPSEDYWKIIAEKRRACLEEALSENKELYVKLENIRNENETLRKMLEESKAVVDVLQEMIAEQEESGIGMSEESSLSINGSLNGTTSKTTENP